MDNFENMLLDAKEGLISYALRLTKNRHEADELVQDTMVKAWENQDKYVDGNFQGWIGTIAKYLFLNKQNSPYNKRIVDVVSRYEDVDPISLDGLWNPKSSVSTDSEIITSEVMSIIRNKLEPKYSKVLIQRLEGYKYEEIAEKEGIPIGTLKERIHRAKLLLKKPLGVYS